MNDARHGRRMGQWSAGLAGLVLVAGLTGPAAGQFNNWQLEVGYDALVSEYGAGALATGAGVAVTLVESGYAPEIFEADGVTLKAQFAGKTFQFRSSPVAYSSHATTVAAYFFGNHSPGVFNQRSLGHGVTSIDLYRAVSGSTGWLEGDYLRSDVTLPPPVSPNHSRVASHAYALTGTSGLVNRLRRVDYLTAVDDFLHVVPSTAGSGSVEGLGVSYNALAVGHPSSANAEGGTLDLFAYPGGRHKPDLVGPWGTTSDSIGILSGAAAMLIELGSNAALSDGSYVSPRTGQTIHHAQTSETIKAALMAGALRHQDSAPGSGAPITTYRDTAEHQTANGLDPRYGAGRFNIYHSYRILDAGEQHSMQDAASGPTAGHIGAYGFDYDPHFGGANGSNAVASYRFATVAEGGRLTATLAWNVQVLYTSHFDLDAVTVHRPMALLLYDVTDGPGQWVAESSSLIDNTQSLWLELAGDREYELRVQPLGDVEPFDWDYGLAWRIDGWSPAAPVPEPGTAAVMVGLAGAGLMTMRRRHR